MKDIETRDDVIVMVNRFYDSVRTDDLLGPIFNKVIGDHWAIHLEKMYSFWQTVLLHEFAYKGSPFPPHRKLPIEAKHFDRWLALFNASIDKEFAGKTTEDAKVRVIKMAEMFQYKLSSNSF